MNADRIRMLFDRCAEEGCGCPTNFSVEREALNDHTCLAALAEQAALALEEQIAKTRKLAAKFDDLARSARRFKEASKPFNPAFLSRFTTDRAAWAGAHEDLTRSLDWKAQG